MKKHRTLAMLFLWLTYRLSIKGGLALLDESGEISSATRCSKRGILQGDDDVLFHLAECKIGDVLRLVK